MSSIKIPPEIEKIFDRPGCDWSESDQGQVYNWLRVNPQLQYLRSSAFRKFYEFSDCVASEVAKEVWSKFCTEPLYSLMTSYNPQKGRRFWNYLLQQFDYFCRDERKRERKKRYREKSLEEIATAQGDERIEFEILDPVQEYRQLPTILTLKECINALPEKYSTVIIMYYCEGKPMREIAKELGLSLADVKVRCYRARQQIKKCLLEEGKVL